jgi:SAM-dependent methyltransferase
MIGWIVRQIGRAARIVRLVASGQSDEVLYALTIRRHGLDFEYVSAADLGLPERRAHFHSSSGGPECARVLRTLTIPPGSRIIDFGSGKGGAAVTLRSFPFSEVVGVELSAQLVEIARANVARLKLTGVHFEQCDAADYTGLDRFTHIYMYNPFPCSVTQQVLTNVRASLQREDREVTLIYRNPLCHAEVVGSGLFTKVEEHKPGEHWWYIYRHTPSRTGSRAR